MSFDSEQIADSADRRDATWLVRALPLFEGLDEPLLDAIVAEIEWFAIPGGSTLFESGDAPDALYCVISGSLGAYATTQEGHRRLVGRIMAGETVGEMALISGNARNATVVALRDTELGRLSRAAFEKLMLSHPKGLLRLAQLMVQRLDSLQRQSRGKRAIPKTFAIVPHDGEVGATTFAAKLATCLERIGRTELVWSQRGADHTSEWFHSVERANEFVVYVCDTAPTSWSKLCLRQADAVLLLARARVKPSEWPALQGYQERAVAAQRTELVLLQADEVAGGVTRGWLDLKPGMAHHHIRSPADIARWRDCLPATVWESCCQAAAREVSRTSVCCARFARRAYR